MKKILRQVLAATLIMTCILQLCVIPNTSAAVTTSKYGAVDEIELLTSLGFVSKSYGPKKAEDTVTRAQFASILGYLRGFDENVVCPGTKFMDIADNYWCADQIYSLYNTGLINGTSVNTFSPNELVTYNQAIKCLVSLLGYDIQAQQAGGYPNGYLAIANELGIAAASSSDTLDFATLAKLVVKAMDTDLMEVNVATANNISLTKTDGLTPLNVYNDIYYEVGVVTDDGLTTLTGSSPFAGKSVVIGNQVLDAGKADIREFLGYRVKYYYKDVNDEQTLLFVLPYKTDVVKLDDEDIDFDNSDYSLKNIYYTLNGKEKRCKIDDYVDVIYNGKAYPEYTLDTLKFNQGDMVLVDNDSDGDYDVIHVNEYYNVLVLTIDKATETIYGKFGEKVETKKFKNVEYLTSTGKATNLNAIKANQIISVYESKDNDYIKIVSCSEAFTGSVSGIENYVSKPATTDESAIEAYKKEAVKMKVLMSEREYLLAADFINDALAGYQGVVMPQVGMTYSFRFDVNGKIAAVEAPTGSQYAYLTRVYYRDDNTEMGGKTNARLVLQDGTLTTVTFAKTVKVNGEKWLGQIEDPDRGVYNYPDFIGENGKFYRQAVKLRLNNAGEIFEIETAKNVTTNSFGYDSTKFTLCYEGSSKYGGHDQRSINNSYSLPDDVIIFSLPPEDSFEEDKISVLTESQLPEGSSTSWKLYDANSAWEVKLAVTESTKSTDWAWGASVVHSVRTELMEDGTVSKVLLIHTTSGTPKAYYESTEGIIPDDIKTGDICRIVASNNKLMNLQVLVSPAKQKTGAIKGATGDNKEWETYYAQPYATGTRGITVSFDGGKTIQGFVRNGTATWCNIYDMEANEYTSAQISDMTSTSPIKEDGSIDLTNSREMVFMHYRNGWIVQFLLIKNIPN